MGLAIAPVPTTVTLDQAKAHLNIEPDDHDDDVELQFFVDAANEWIATQVDETDLPSAPVQLGTLELIRHWWGSQRGPAAQALDADGTLGLLGFAIPTRVKEILAPYLLGEEPPAPRGSFPDATDWPDPTQW